MTVSQRNQGRPVSEYFGAAVAAGLSVDGLHEAPVSEGAIETNPIFPLYPELTRAAFEGMPWLLVLEASKP